MKHIRAAIFDDVEEAMRSETRCIFAKRKTTASSPASLLSQTTMTFFSCFSKRVILVKEEGVYVKDHAQTLERLTMCRH